MKKHLGMTFVMLVAIMAMASLAMAGPGPRGGTCCGDDSRGERQVLRELRDLTPEQKSALEKIREDYQDKAQALHSEIRAKHLELHYLAANSKTEPQTIKTLVKEITELRNKALELRKSAVSALRKDLNLTDPQARALLAGPGSAREGCPMGQGHKGCNLTDCRQKLK